MDMDESDKTPICNEITGQTQQSLTGFALYESAFDFFVKLGIPRQQIESLPEVLMTSVGMLIKENNEYNQDLEKLVRELSKEKKDSMRLRAQRDALRSMFQRHGHDPMPDYHSQVGIRCIPDPERPDPQQGSN